MLTPSASSSSVNLWPRSTPTSVTAGLENLANPVLAAALAITAVALVTGGAAVGRITGRSMLRSGLRQLALGRRRDFHRR